MAAYGAATIICGDIPLARTSSSCRGLAAGRGTPAALLIGAGTLVVPSAAHAQRAAAPARPQIERLEIGSDAGLAPGAELELRLFGTPRGTASVRISAAKTINVVLKETGAGSGEYAVYYTIKRTDRLAPGQTVRATLRRGNLKNSAS